MYRDKSLFFKKMSKCVLITGNKEDPVKVANEMRSLRNSSGKLRDEHQSKSAVTFHD